MRGRRRVHRHRPFAGDRAGRGQDRDEAVRLCRRPRRTRPRPRCRACSRPATSPTTSTARRSPPPAWAAWRRSRPSGSSPRTTSSATRRSSSTLPTPQRSDRDGRWKTAMDWDKLKVFHAAAEAGSFTHAGEQLGLSQSAVSRQVSALEQELSVSLFHRHARGLILTEQGELLYRTAHEVFMKLEAARAKLTDSREKPHGELQGHHHARHRHALADAAARRIHRPLSRHPHHADHHRRGARPRHARGRRRDPAAPADAARPDPAQAVLGAFPRLRLAGISQALRHAAHARGARQPPHPAARRQHGAGLPAEPQLADRSRRATARARARRR